MSREVRHDGRGGFRIRFGYDRRLVDLVKSLPGRRWNPDEKFWSAPEDIVIEMVDALLPERFRFDEATLDLYRACGGTAALEPAGTPPDETGQPGLFDAPASAGADDLTVSRLNEKVREVITAAFPAPVWLVGEVSGFNKAAHKRHVGFQLVERDADGRLLSEVNATLFESTREEIAARLAAAGDPFRIEDEIQVRLRARVELYVPWGSYRVIVEELDVHYTLGEAARRREEIIRKLTAEGLLEKNRSLDFPAVPLRVGLVTSLGSDAFNDVRRTLQESGYAFSLTAHGARVQGRQTEPSVLAALAWFERRAEGFDVVLVCRGGGSRTDLAWFDSEALGRAVASFPLPVVIGIGHEQDSSVLDAVGWRCKTPTAAAGLLVETVAGALDTLERSVRAILERADRRLRDARGRIVERARRLARGAGAALDREQRELARRAAAIPRAASVRIEGARGGLEAGVRQLLQGVRRDVATTSRGLERIAAAIGPAGLRWLRLQDERTGSRMRRLRLADPKRVVERGFAVLRGEDGRVLVDASAAPAGVALRAEMRKGTLRLRSEGPER